MTSSTAKTIQIYLPTGEPRGIRIAEVTTRIVQAIVIPRSELAEGKKRKELDDPGVYFLFGDGEEDAKPIVYIGQTEDARKRFDDHNKKKTFWKTAIFCFSKTQNFTQAHIRWLEWCFMHRATEVARYTLDNDQVPKSGTSGGPTEPKCVSNFWRCQRGRRSDATQVKPQFPCEFLSIRRSQRTYSLPFEIAQFGRHDRI